MARPAPTARSSALRILNSVLGEGRLMSEVLGTGLLDPLSAPDRARAQRLANDTLRGMERADRLLNRHLRKQPPLSVRNVLRLATVEICMGGDAHGVVNEAVALVGQDRRTFAMKGLVNAILRKVADTGHEQWELLRAPRLPKWLRVPLVEAYGPERVAAIEKVQFDTPPLDITPKDAAQIDHWAQELGGQIVLGGSIRMTNAGQVSALPGFADGSWWVQDAAAALPVRLLGDISGKTAIDLCSAPGGKTMQLAAAGAKVMAVDNSQTRMGRVKENLERTGLVARTKIKDALQTSGEFDAVVLDAPCSATGTMRRHPDLPHAKDGSDFGALIELQSQLLDHAIGLLKPGGRLVYCTCSLLPDEGECQVEEALGRHQNLQIDQAAMNAEFIDPQMRSDEGGLRLTPDMLGDKGGLDGFYIAVLTKT